jgi:hypothetical protein
MSESAMNLNGRKKTADPELGRRRLLTVEVACYGLANFELSMGTLTFTSVSLN